jgi:hypothetical protein
MIGQRSLLGTKFYMHSEIESNYGRKIYRKATAVPAF